MAITAFVAVAAVAAVGSAAMTYEGQRKAASQAEDAAIREAEQAKVRAKEEERIAREKKDFETSLAKEQLATETQLRQEKKEWVKGQMEKRDKEVLAAAIAGYAASGIDIEDSGTAKTVFKRIQEESVAERGEVEAEYQRFVTARTTEFQQLKKSKNLTFEWFKSRLHRETEWDIANRYSEASAYRSKAKMAQIGGAFAVTGAAASGAAGTMGTYKFYNS